jgi:hypothetical protein
MTLKVLAALSTSTRFRRQETLADIYDVVFEDPKAVTEAIAYLKSRRLVIDRGSNAELELCHDFVAEYFQTRCGNELRPIDRDNVVFHLEAGVSHMGGALLDRSSRELQKAILGWIVFAVLAISMMIRLLGLGLPWVRLGTISPSYSTGKVFDVMYIPIFIAHGAWMIYVTLFYVRIFAMLNEKGWARLLTHLVPIFMGLCVVIAYFVPYMWVCSIGLGGMFLGLKLTMLSHNRELSAAARTRFGEFGRSTLATLSLLTIAGAAVVWVSFALQGQPQFEQRWIAVNLLESIVVTVLCGILTPYHVVGAAVSEYLGLLSRSPRGAIPRSGI